MSTHVKRVLSNRLLLAISLVLTMIAFSLVLAQPPQAAASPKAAATAPATATACPSQTVEYTYYTDASKTEACGYRISTCYCSIYRDGCRTDFYTITTSDC